MNANQFLQELYEADYEPVKQAFENSENLDREGNRIEMCQDCRKNHKIVGYERCHQCSQKLGPGIPITNSCPNIVRGCTQKKVKGCLYCGECRKRFVVSCPSCRDGERLAMYPECSACKQRKRRKKV